MFLSRTIYSYYEFLYYNIICRNRVITMEQVINIKNGYYVGIDIGGSYIKMGLIDYKHNFILSRTNYETPKNSLNEFINKLEKNVRNICSKERLTLQEINGIGIGIPGFVSKYEISKIWPFLSFLEGNIFMDRIHGIFSCPIIFENDARIIALGEYYFGYKQKIKRLLSITLGTGVGVAFVNNGRFSDQTSYSHLAGHISIKYGEPECYCGISGCLESLVSADSIINNFYKLNHQENKSKIDVEDIYKKALRNDCQAKKVINNVVGYISAGLNSYINIYSPDVIVIGGGQAKGLEKYMKIIRKNIISQPFRRYSVKIETSKLGSDAGIYGTCGLFLA